MNKFLGAVIASSFISLSSAANADIPKVKNLPFAQDLLDYTKKQTEQIITTQPDFETAVDDYMKAFKSILMEHGYSNSINSNYSYIYTIIRNKFRISESAKITTKEMAIGIFDEYSALISNRNNVNSYITGYDFSQFHIQDVSKIDFIVTAKDTNKIILSFGGQKITLPSGEITYSLIIEQDENDGLIIRGNDNNPLDIIHLRYK